MNCDPVRMYSGGARLDLLRSIKSVTAYSVVFLGTSFTHICFFLIAFSPVKNKYCDSSSMKSNAACKICIYT